MEPTQQSQTSSTVSSIAIPLAIVFGFGLIALAIYFSGFGNNQTTNNTNVATTPTTNTTTNAKIRPVDETDHIKGNPNAPILVVEYSDYDCPFCKQFHETMTRIMDEYGVGGNVAWVYRQFPIAQLHPNSERISQAALCVGDLGGNDAFWSYSDLIFAERELNEPTNISKLPEYAEKVGVKKDELIACLDSGKNRTVLDASLQDGAGAGIRGTPQSFVIVGNQMATIEGAQPYAVVKQIIENLLGQLEGQKTPAKTN